MQTYKIEHTYGCGSIGEFFIDADSEAHARQIAHEDYFLESDDILGIEPILVNKAVAA